MSAADHLSPDQFGFKVAPHDDWIAAQQSYNGNPRLGQRGGRPGRMSPNAELHTGQPGLFPDRVKEYVDRPGIASDTGKFSGVEIYHHQGKMFVGDGHHRIAAARQRGAKSIRVTHYGE